MAKVALVKIQHYNQVVAS